MTLPEDVPAFSTYYDTGKLWPRESLDRLAALRAGDATSVTGERYAGSQPSR